MRSAVWILSISRFIDNTELTQQFNLEFIFSAPPLPLPVPFPRRFLLLAFFCHVPPHIFFSCPLNTSFWKNCNNLTWVKESKKLLHKWKKVGRDVSPYISHSPFHLTPPPWIPVFYILSTFHPSISCFNLLATSLPQVSGYNSWTFM